MGQHSRVGVGQSEEWCEAVGCGHSAIYWPPRFKLGSLGIMDLGCCTEIRENAEISYLETSDKATTCLTISCVLIFYLCIMVPMLRTATEKLKVTANKTIQKSH